MAGQKASDGSPGQAALDYVSRSWPVFPCHPATKRPLVALGFKAATIDAEQVSRWWLKWPKAMIGIPTGAPIGCVVIDLDAGTDDATGEVFELADLIERLENEIGCQLPPTQTANTPRGGRHLYFQLPSGLLIKSRTGVLPRIDVRASGGYVIGPPSRRADGNSYKWEVGLDVMPPAPAPPELLSFLKGRATRQSPVSSPTTGAYGRAALVQEARQVASAARGQCNQQLNFAAFKLGQLVASGELAEPQVIAALEAAASECGLTSDDGLQSVRRTVASGLSAGGKQPRTAPYRSQRSTIERAASANDGSDRDRLDSELARYELTDRGNAKRFVERNCGRLIFTSQGWLHWKDGRWVSDEQELQVRKGVHATVDAIKREAIVMRKSETSDDEGES